MEELKEKLVEEITEHLDSDKVSAEYLDVLGRLLATILPYVYADKAEKQNDKVEN